MVIERTNKPITLDCWAAMMCLHHLHPSLSFGSSVRTTEFQRTPHAKTVTRPITMLHPTPTSLFFRPTTHKNLKGMQAKGTRSRTLNVQTNRSRPNRSVDVERTFVSLKVRLSRGQMGIRLKRSRGLPQSPRPLHPL